MSKEQGFSRRNFMKASGLVASAAALGGVMATAVTSSEAHAAGAHAASTSTEDRAFRGRMFFANDLQFDTISQAAERIFPKDENGPGAIDLAVPYFIDNQLASGYGFNSREYTMGPHFEGAATQGYQTALNNRDLFLQGIDAINLQSKATFGKNFTEITDAQKDEILKMCEAGKIPMPGVSSAYFFSRLKLTVLAGVYADPIYNGNKNMEGWKMKKYPGAQMSYFGIMTKAEFQHIPPVSLADH